MNLAGPNATDSSGEPTLYDAIARKRKTADQSVGGLAAQADKRSIH
jgi:hypothetical protein